MILVNGKERVSKRVGDVLAGRRVELIEIKQDDISRLLDMSDENLRRTLEVISMRFGAKRSQSQLDDIEQYKQNIMSYSTIVRQGINKTKSID